MGELVTLTYQSSVDIVEEMNSSFDHGVLRVCYMGDNRNMSSISKDVFIDCMDSIYNCPVVCNYDRETDSIGSHDVSFVKVGNKYKLCNDTTPIGVVPTGANWWFETTDEKEYLCVDVLIWKRQDAYEHIKTNGITDESMEINVLSSHMSIDNMMIIDKFEFNAFCLLESANPCYEGASLVMFEEDDGFMKAYAEMIDELKTVGRECFSSDVTDSTRKEEYGLEQKDVILNEEGVNPEEFEEKDPETNESFSLTAGQLSGQIFEALCSETYTDEWGTWNKYGYMDHDTDTVYVIDYTNDYKLFGLSYAMNGDNVVIDFSTPIRKKVCYVDFEEGEPETNVFASVAKDIESRTSEVDKFSAEQTVAEFEKKEEEFAAKEEEMSAKIEELAAFKAEVEEKERIAEVDAVFEQFEDLNDIEEFMTLRKEYGDMSVQDIEEKCFSIRGRTMKFSQKSTKKAPARIPAKEPSNGDEPYGGLFDLYPPSN